MLRRARRPAARPRPLRSSVITERKGVAHGRQRNGEVPEDPLVPTPQAIGKAVVTLLGICGCTHKEGYLDIVMVAIAGALLALVAVIALGSVAGSF